MESLDVLNLRANECSFLEIVLADVRHYIENIVLENEKQSILVFPPFNARNRFLLHSLVQTHFNELSTISIGSSHGRRTVVHHCSLKPMLCRTESEESKEIKNENCTSVQRAYRTPNERKAQEKLFHSLMPKKNVDKIQGSIHRRQCKRPDIPIYVPKARRGPSTNSGSNIIRSTSNSSNLTPACKPNTDLSNQNVSNDIPSLLSNETKDSLTTMNLNNNKNNCIIASTSFETKDTVSDMPTDDTHSKISTSFNDVPCSILESSTNNLEILNDCQLNSSFKSSEIIEGTNSSLVHNSSENDTIEPKLNNDDDISVTLDVSQCLSDNSDTTYTQNSTIVDTSDFQSSNVNNKKTADEIQVCQKAEQLASLAKVDDMARKTEKHEMHTEDEIVSSNTSGTHLCTEDDSNCPHLDDTVASGSLTDIEEKTSKDTNKELPTRTNLEIDDKSLEVVKSNEIKDKAKTKKKKKKKILDVNECCWEDLYDKEDDYVHPLLMKEIVSTMGKVQVKCAKEDYRSHQTIDERSGDGECVIEVYGFSSDLKTIDLMNQFAEFRKNHFEIIWVDDTHALAVFESPNLADRALNTSFALVKTRPLKDAIKESKLKSETVVPLPATRPKTCTAMARRLVSSALGLKMAVSSDLLNAERTLLANAKEKKIRDAQQKQSIWNDT